MAQTANFTPVVIDQDNSIQYLGQTLQNKALEKQKRQLAVQEAMLKQRNTNNAIFGEASKNIREYYDNSKGLPQQERDMELRNAMELLKTIPSDSPEYLKLAVQATNSAATKFSAGNRYFEGVEGVIKEYSDKGFKINPDAVRQFANTFMYDYKTEGQDNTNLIEGIKAGVVQLPAGMTKEEAIATAIANGPRQVKVRKDLSTIQDPALLVRQEIVSHPELYTDRPLVKEAAFGEVDKLYKEAKAAGDKLTLDPTGTKTTTIGTDYSLSMFDTEEESTDKVTGLKYKRPKLSLSKVDGIFYKGGNSVEVLGEEQFDKLINSGKNVQQEVMIGALENIRAHNAEVFRRAGIPSPEAAAMSVSKNNASQFASIPGFANPFDEGKIEYFQRAAAADLLKQSGRYDDKGYVLGFKLDRGVNKANPKSGVTVNIGQTGPGVEKGRMPAYKTLLGSLKAGENPMASTKIDNNIKNALLTIADENGVFRAANVKVTPEMIDTKIAQDGSVAIYSKATGKLIAALSEQSFDQRVNEVAGGKFVGSATVQGNPSTTGSGITWKK
jgi:hypothetical protein